MTNIKLQIFRRRQILLAAVSPLLGTLVASFTQGAPLGAKVVAGAATVSGTGVSLLVRQTTNRSIINWNSFSLDSNETVKFELPSAMSAVLNRVTSLSPSELNGTLSSNGSVYLINPNGILVGPHGQIGVHGFVASTLDVDNAAFMNGGGLLFQGGSTAAVTNQGTIQAASGNVVLIAQQVQNSGAISAPAGSAILAAGASVLLQQSSTPHVTVRVTGAGTVSNSGLIQATKAQLAANGGNAMAMAINNTGLIRATGVRNDNGRIYLTAGPSGQASNIGTLDASSTAGVGGQIVVTGEHVLIGDQAHLNTNGATGGGQILIGGSWQNSDPAVPQSLGALVESGAVLEASATQSGNGGTIVVRSNVANPDSITRVYGSLLALGAGSGSGGRVETSGYSLDAAGAIVSTSSPNGQAGQWLLDPYDLAITNATSNFDTSGNPWIPTSSGGTIDTATLTAALTNTSVTISTGNNGGDLGNIAVSAPIVKNAGNNNVTLELDAANDITITQNISATVGSLNLIFDAHQGTAGAIILGANLSTNGGFVHFGTGRTSNGALVGGDVYFNGTSAQSINTSGGAVVVNGQILIANPDGLTIDSGGGDVTFQGTVDSGDTYTFVNTSLDWDDALVAAKGSTAGGAAVGDTYLATITSSLENTIASNAADFQPAWLGGHRPIVNGTTSQTWYWVTGPEGLENGGKGLAFFTQNFTGGSGVPIGNAFTNFNPGEPNNFGGTDTTQNSESTLQFIGTNALWNDLPETGFPLPSLVETNLAPSALAVNAAAGHVSFNGAVGSNKPLAALTVTGPTAINGGGVTTTGAQTYHTPVTLGAPGTVLAVTAGDLNIGQNISYPGASAGSLTLQASGSVIVAPNVAIAATGTGAMDVTADSAAFDGTSGAIVMNSGSSITANGGNVTLTDTGNTAGIGISLQSGARIVSAGDVTLRADTMSLAAGSSIQGTGDLTVLPTTPGTSIGLGTSAGGTLNLNSSALATIQPGFASITFGDSVNTSSINIDRVTPNADTHFISGTGGITISGALNNGSHHLSLTSAGPVTQTAPITASSLLLDGTGPFSLDDASNSVATLAADVSGGAFLYTNSGSLTIGTVGTTQGVRDSGGPVTIVARGKSSDLTLNQPVTGSGTGNTVVLAAGRNFINAGGTAVISTGSGRFLVYSTIPAKDTFDGLTAGQIFGVSYTPNSPSHLTAEGNQFLFSSAKSNIDALLPAIRRQWNLDMTLAPNFRSYPDVLPVAQISTTPSAEENARVFAPGGAAHHGSMPARRRAAANATAGGEPILDGALAHVSSFDLKDSSSNSR
jgi:filamentous hemagglutinin family protein